jgi:hypothetical protein
MMSPFGKTMKTNPLLGTALVIFTGSGCNKNTPPKLPDPAVREVQAAWDEFKTGSLSNKGKYRGGSRNEGDA